MAVVAVFGMELIELFHAVTISKTSTHKSLQVKLETPWYPGISDELFDNVIKGYKTHLVQSVKEYAFHHLDKPVKLANFFHPDLAETLARQRKYYVFSDNFGAELTNQ